MDGKEEKLRDALIQIGEHWCGFDPYHCARNYHLLLEQVDEVRSFAKKTLEELGLARYVKD